MGGGVLSGGRCNGFALGVGRRDPRQYGEPRCAILEYHGGRRDLRAVRAQRDVPSHEAHVVGVALQRRQQCLDAVMPATCVRMVQQKMIAIGVAELRPNGLLLRDEGRRFDSGYCADCEPLGEAARAQRGGWLCGDPCAEFGDALGQQRRAERLSVVGLREGAGWRTTELEFAVGEAPRAFEQHLTAGERL